MKLSLAVISILLLGQLSCSEDKPDISPVGDPSIDTSFKDDPSITTLNGTWKVYCFENHVTRDVEYKTQKNSLGLDIIVEFNDAQDPHGFTGIKTTNSFGGEFNYTGARQFIVKGVISTMAGQPSWADDFDKLIRDALYRDVTFIINSDMLRITYDFRTKSVVLVKQ